MKLAVAGKGGVGKTSVTVWVGDYLARCEEEVWLVDADTALSLGQALGLPEGEIPTPLIQEKELIRERVGEGLIHLNPEVQDLPERLARRAGNLNLLVMGGIAAAGGGCACAANALLKALLAHLIIQRRQWVIVDLEAGVEHLGRGTIQFVDGLIVVSEPSLRSLQTASRISTLARNMRLTRQVLLINRATNDFRLPEIEGLPPLVATIPHLPSLANRQLNSPSVLNLIERDELDRAVGQILAGLRTKN
ncbi:MAG: ArsA-related P-loop ATPase [Syntrophales bacterium]|nr:ArsA-related P-loop ATPase [Syntrophales bacterium]